MPKVRIYKVWYGGHSSGRVRAKSSLGARRKAWALLGGFKYGWSKADFMRNATVEQVG